MRPEQRVSNIYKMYRASRVSFDNPTDPATQVTMYDPGLGTDLSVTATTGRAIASSCSASVAAPTRFAASRTCFGCAAFRPRQLKVLFLSFGLTPVGSRKKPF